MFVGSKLPCYTGGQKVKTLALISQKGGSGKTTLAVHIAVCAVKAGKYVALFDLDPQGSAADWHETRGRSDELAAVKASPKALPALLEKVKSAGVDLVILDTAPHSNNAAAEAAKHADFVLVPCRPSRFDLKAMPSTFEILKLNNTPAAVVLNVCPRGHLVDEAAELLQAQGFPVLKERVSQRVAFSHAVIDGLAVHEYEPDGKAAQDITDLFKTIRKRLKL